MSVFKKAALKRLKDRSKKEQLRDSKGAISQADSQNLLEMIRDAIQKVEACSDQDKSAATEHLNQLKDKHYKLLAARCIAGPQG